MNTSVARHKSRRFKYARIALLVASAITTTAFAAPVVISVSGGAPSVEVRYDDLNLTTAEGTQSLYRRIAEAAKLVCPDEDVRNLSIALESHRCQASAIERAVRDVNNPQLALVHASRTRHG